MRYCFWFLQRSHLQHFTFGDNLNQGLDMWPWSLGVPAKLPHMRGACRRQFRRRLLCQRFGCHCFQIAYVCPLIRWPVPEIATVKSLVCNMEPLKDVRRTIFTCSCTRRMPMPSCASWCGGCTHEWSSCDCCSDSDASRGSSVSLVIRGFRFYSSPQ